MSVNVGSGGTPRTFLDFWWGPVLVGLPVAAPAGALLPLAYGTSPFVIGVTAGFCALCLTGGYAARWGFRRWQHLLD